tara:strand:- start:328 stop:573 length:246 start_codon:yes stop_codon:yes gene_type:complete
MKLEIINHQQIVEGITASIFVPLTIIFFRYFNKKYFKSESFFIVSMSAWFTTWIIRKISVNVYSYLKEKHDWENKIYHLTI